MSNEIKALVQVRYENGKAKAEFTPSTININQTTQGGHFPIVVVDSSAYETIPVGDVSTPGIVYGRNLDTSNYVTVAVTTSSASTTAYPFQRVAAGNPFFLQWDNTLTHKWKANTADVKVQIGILES